MYRIFLIDGVGLIKMLDEGPWESEELATNFGLAEVLGEFVVLPTHQHRTTKLVPDVVYDRWKYDPGGMMVLSEDDQSHICDVRGWGKFETELGSREACKAMDKRGYLLAAAPEMLEALDGIVSCIDSGDRCPTSASLKPSAQLLKHEVKYDKPAVTRHLESHRSN